MGEQVAGRRSGGGEGGEGGGREMVEAGGRGGRQEQDKVVCVILSLAWSSGQGKSTTQWISQAVLSVVLGPWSVRFVGWANWVDCRCFLFFLVFLGVARRLELSPCNTSVRV